ncbi:ATP-binding protein [Streptomyces sp. NPDC018833]|uniref:ATP-binding protein n=1 Tax=Streptomyces sp. NPDC018833 TaxID=3365053 RepID=UPI00378B1CFF
MIIDPAQPWGVAIDYAGRAAVSESGHTVNIRVYDNTFDGVLRPDPLTGEYPPVYITAQIEEYGAEGAVLRGNGLVILNASGGTPVAPDTAAVQQAVDAALADFETRRAAQAALCATWEPPAAP